METIENITLHELKVYRELLENRIANLRKHQIGDEYYPPYTDKEVHNIKEFEQKAINALSVVNKTIRKKLDAFIDSID